MDEIRAIVARALVDRVEHHADSETGLRNEQVESPDLVTVAAAETMVARSSIPRASRPAAAAATATVLAEGFQELPVRVADWRLEGTDTHVRREAERYGAGLGDQTLAAVRVFEAQPPAPLDVPSDRDTSVGNKPPASVANEQAASVANEPAASIAGEPAASVADDLAARFANDPALPRAGGGRATSGEQGRTGEQATSGEQRRTGEQGRAGEHGRADRGSTGSKRHTPGSPAL
ncbi:hypothetical protein GCM10009804_55950 [Kribbella hippodromi]|uniref:Uncharacterized protein n=1 Tax=Kribbella hippodromi TaxID=434347 RepID=A0ABP4PZ35_9ACTN